MQNISSTGFLRPTVFSILLVASVSVSILWLKYSSADFFIVCCQINPKLKKSKKDNSLVFRLKLKIKKDLSGTEKVKIGCACYLSCWVCESGLQPAPRGLHAAIKLANSCWQTQVGVCVRTEQKKSLNTLANSWRQIELASILANFFTNFFVLVNSCLTSERLVIMDL